ncbi:MAG TPA: type I restriction-modification enzyme R subunit C-terminal domain-containing protein, partial [Rhabdochlamydiaceae bacterium]
KVKAKVRLRDGKEREIRHMIATSFWSSDGRPISAEEFLHSMYGKLPDFFKSEDELRRIWSNPVTRKALLEKLAEAGYGLDELSTLQKLINAEKSDLYDVLDYVSFAMTPITREKRVAQAQAKIFSGLDNKHKEFLEFVLSKYIETGVEELDQEKLPDLLTLKYQALSDAEEILGSVDEIRAAFIGFQKHLYEKV